jgi:hypothetical protein
MMRLPIAVLAGLLLAACFDPVHDDRVEALGPEVAGVKRGPLHRPGQPCTVCHGGEGPGSPTFAVAGTAFERQKSLAPLVGGVVRLVDTHSRQLGIFTNEAGNFYVQEDDFTLSFPLFASVELGDEAHQMQTPIFRAASCAECHADPPGRSSVGHVYVFADP